MTLNSDFTGKRLFILRHAMALPHAENGDKMRALAPQGKDDALALGKVMAAQNYAPDTTLCSPALRTKETLNALQQNIKTPNTNFLDILYNGSTGDYLYEVQRVSDEHQNILLIAHNPSIYELVILLAAQGQDTVLQRLTQGYKPASFSVIHCACENWANIQPAENELVSLIDPIDYNAPARPTRWM